MIYIVDHVMQYCEEVGWGREKVCLVHCMPAMQPAKDLESPAGGIQGARQSHCILQYRRPRHPLICMAHFLKVWH